MEKSRVIFFLLSLVTVTSAQTADVEVRINEEEPEDSFVVNLSQYPALFLEVSEEDKHKLTFNILDKASFEASFFAMDSVSGQVRIAKRVDREQVCDSTDTPSSCALDFNVAIQGKDGLTFSNIASVRVYIDDINDNSPNFPADQVDLEISEGAKVGTMLKVSGPQDLDSLPNNTIQRYDSTLALPVFSITATRNKDGTSFLNLKLESVLDRETTDQYDFNIIAYDGGDPPRSDFLRVVITVVDENDNVPEFESEVYNVNVGEDAVVGSEIVRVRARDKDAGPFGAVSYRFSKLASPTIHQLFHINATSGLISLQSSIEHSAGSGPYSVVVEAFDGGDPPSVAQTVVNIHVLNTGNNAPVVRIVTVSEGDTTEISVLESSKVDDFVAFVNVEDSDDGENGEVTCSMEKNGAQFRLVELLNKGYKVLLGREVDRELVDRYEAAIVCRDRGSPPLSTELPFTVVIADVNDNDPVFDQSSYSGSLAENNAEGQYVLQISAIDMDLGDNAFLTYTLQDTPSHEGEEGEGKEGQTLASRYLSIQPQSGVVTARRALDREATPVITCTVVAVDGGKEPRTGTARLTVTVRDVNDNTPRLHGLPYHFNVSEGAAPGHLVAIMSADDLDQGLNGEVEFFFAGSVNGEVPFLVHPNGSIVVSGVLDRETSRSHVFTVLARDKGAIPKSNSTQVTVTVTDINDNAPAILFPTNANHSVVITTHPENGITLGRIIAYDVDEGNSSSLVYSIHSGNLDNVFGIDREKGKLYLADMKKLKNPHVYHVVLRVHDSGVPPMFAETSLQIEVNFPNITFPGIPGDNAPSSNENGSKKSRDSYIIIVAVIGGATLVLSGIIIGAICFVLRSERHRKSRDSSSSFKNHYVPAPVKFDVPSEKLEDTKCPKSFERRSSQGDLSSTGLILSPKGLQTKGEVQKKVSFSLDEPDGEMYDQFGQPREVPTAPFPHHSHHDGDAVSMAWKRLVNPDDMNSDTSGDSGTCDSGRGASVDDIHLDSSMDKLSQGKHAGSALTNTNRIPAPANIYAPPSSFHSGGGSFRQPHGQTTITRPPSAASSASATSGAPRPNFLHTGSYHEGRRDNYRTPGGGKMLPQRPALHRPYPHVTPHPQQTSLAALHPEPLLPPRVPVGGGGGGGEGGGVVVGPKQGGGWVPPRSAQPHHGNQHQHQHHHRRQGSSLSVEDDASTTTSGSYTLSPDHEIRMEGNVSPDVIV
ncbi:protocadherin gamma-B5-like [Babylonia areolata]|uniref:protocadherin gamma-B5-like n=1 Tax=Babylonia areolata TaxID=304850 RepID=UPI003FD5E22A